MDKKLKLTILITLSWLFIKSQTIGFPVSFSDSLTATNNFRTNLNKLQLGSFNNQTLVYTADSLTANCLDCNFTHYFARGINQTINLKNSSHYYNPSINNGKLWIYKISSPTAIGLQTFFNKFILPPEASLYVYNSDRSIVYGPYTSFHTPSDTNKLVQFSTPFISDKDLYIEYFEPNNSSFQGNIQINNIMYGFRSFAGQFVNPNGTQPAICHSDVACQAGWESAANSVGIITAYTEVSLNSGIYAYLGNCSGTLLNNTNQDGDGYFLTAAHCYNPNNSNPNYDPSTWQIYFDYQQTTCNASYNYINFNKIVFGANILSQDQFGQNNNPINSDYLLLKLNPSKEYLQGLNLCYSGWDSKDIISTTNSSNIFYTIHHPRGDYKKITTGNNLTPNNSGSFNSVDYFNLTYLSGTTEPGSSGGGLFNSNKLLVGTVKGVRNLNFPNPPIVCSYNTFIPICGRFSRHWTLGNFKQWLDPANVITSNNTSLVGKCFLPANTVPSYGGGYSYTGNNYQGGFSPGIRVNGKPLTTGGNGTAYLCDNNSTLFSATPFTANYFALRASIYTNIPCGFFGNNVGFATPHPDCWVEKSAFGVPTKCACKHSAYKTTVTELNYDLSTTGVSVSNIIMTGEVSNSSNNATIPAVGINVNALGLNFKKGHYYSFFAETTTGGFWDYSQRIFYMFTDDVNINNANITQPIYANNTIEINNSTISNSPDITASMQVQITGETSINNANVYISNVNCGQFRIINPDNVPSKNVEFENNDLQTNINLNQTTDKNLPIKNKIIPNPTSGNFIYQLNLNKGGYIKVSNTIGDVLYTENVSAIDELKNISLKNATNGIYFLSYYDKTNALVETQKIILN